MIEKHADIAGMNTFIVHPERCGPHPVVLFYMDGGPASAARSCATWRAGSRAPAIT